MTGRLRKCIHGAYKFKYQTSLPPADDQSPFEWLSGHVGQPRKLGGFLPDHDPESLPPRGWRSIFVQSRSFCRFPHPCLGLRLRVQTIHACPPFFKLPTRSECQNLLLNATTAGPQSERRCKPKEEHYLSSYAAECPSNAGYASAPGPSTPMVYLSAAGKNNALGTRQLAYLSVVVGVEPSLAPSTPAARS